MLQLDAFDRKILFELDCDSRQSISQIAKRVRLGRDLVSYRIDKLQENGVIKRFAAMVNPYKLGLTVYKTYLKLEVNRDRLTELISYLNRHPRTYWVAECHGRWDLIVSILARTPLEFYTFQDRFFSDFRDLIIGYNVYTLVNYWWFPKKYLLGNRWREEWRNGETQPNESQRLQGWRFETPEFTFGAVPETHALDHFESMLTEVLGQNSKASIVELAKQLDTTPAIVKYRLEKLEEQGIIAGYRVDIDQSILGTTLFKVLVHLRDYDRTQEISFREFCRQHPLITCYVQQIGDCRLEFEVEVKDYTQFHSLMDEVRERFSKYIRFTDYMVIHKDHHHRSRAFLDSEEEYSVQPRLVVNRSI